MPQTCDCHNIRKMMEYCMDVNALKSSFPTEKAMKSVNQQVIFDDIWCVTGDDFIIDDFFDIPSDDNMNDDDNNNNSNSNSNSNSNNKDDEDEEKYSNSNSSNSLSSSYDLLGDSAHFSAHLAIPCCVLLVTDTIHHKLKTDSGRVSGETWSIQLIVSLAFCAKVTIRLQLVTDTDDDIQELELWSHFMDDSVPDPSLPFPKSSLDAYFKQTGFTIVNRVEPCTKQGVVSGSCFPRTVPVKKRSKRSRLTRNRSWLTGSNTKSSSLESTSLFACPVHEMGLVYTHGKPVMKNPRKETTTLVNGGIEPVQRRCSHCQVTKTPQWRAGPNGPKTLCNACGVRFKSGRLLPEYRPACSPTFSSEVHSNSHRKVLEMRLKREMVEAKSHTGLI